MIQGNIWKGIKELEKIGYDVVDVTQIYKWIN